MAPEQDNSYIRHVLLSELKKISKEVFGKGPERINIRMIDEIIVLEFYGFLRRIELEMLQSNPHLVETVLQYREALFDFAKGEVAHRIELIIGRKIIKHVYSVDVSNNSTICLVILDRPL